MKPEQIQALRDLANKDNFWGYEVADVLSLCDVLEQAYAAMDKPRANLLFEIHNLRSQVNELLSLDVGMRKENQRLRNALEGLLLSADCTWEERNEGHDWKEACEFAREVLKGGASE